MKYSFEAISLSHQCQCFSEGYCAGVLSCQDQPYTPYPYSTISYPYQVTPLPMTPITSAEGREVLRIFYRTAQNKYPTRQEKNQLSIQTGLTMTQVSTFFANARRKDKKQSRPSTSQ